MIKPTFPTPIIRDALIFAEKGEHMLPEHLSQGLRALIANAPTALTYSPPDKSR